jgi:hypothetical protein
MKKTDVFIFFLFTIFIFVSCQTGIEINTECALKHTTEMVTLETSTTNDMRTTIVNLSWYWIWGTPPGDGVIIERSLGAQYDSVGFVTPVESLMTYFDTSAVLTPTSHVSYQLSLLNGKAIDHFFTSDFTIPEAQHFIEPSTDTIHIPDTTLTIVFQKLQDYDTTDIHIYRTSFTSIDSILSNPIEDILSILTNPIYSTTTADTVIIIPRADTLFETTNVHVIKISASKIATLDYITDTSIGLRVLLRMP